MSQAARSGGHRPLPWMEDQLRDIDALALAHRGYVLAHLVGAGGSGAPSLAALNPPLFADAIAAGVPRRLCDLAIDEASGAWTANIGGQRAEGVGFVALVRRFADVGVHVARPFIDALLERAGI